MKSLIISVFIFIAIPFAASSQNKKLLKHQYQLINNYFGTGLHTKKAFKLYLPLLPFKHDKRNFANYLTPENLDSYLSSKETAGKLFTAADCFFMKKQLEERSISDSLNLQLLTLSPDRILINETRSNDDLMSPKFTTYQICLPLFSCNYNLALFYVAYYCGSRCAMGEIEIMKKQKDGDWRVLGTIDVFIS